MGKLKVHAQESATTHLLDTRVITSMLINVSTKDIPFAGTDAHVYLNLVSLGNYLLNTIDEDDFEIGDTRSYGFETDFTLGALRKAVIELGHDNTGKSPGWCVSNVSLQIKLQGSNLIYLYKQWEEIGWLALGEAPHNVTVVQLQEGM